jgi:hypothetical protein
MDAPCDVRCSVTIRSRKPTPLIAALEENPPAVQHSKALTPHDLAADVIVAIIYDASIENPIDDLMDEIVGNDEPLRSC